MRRWRLLICACVLAVGISAAGAGAALASTFYVNGTSGNDTNACTEPANPCKTIGAAVTKSEVALGNATIEVAAGIYKEALDLANPADGGITINGAGSGPGGTQIVGLKKVSSETVDVALPESSATLSNLQVVVPNEENTGAAIQAEGALTLENVVVGMRDPSSADGVELEELGSLTMNGSSVYMEPGATGTAVASFGVPTTLDGSTVVVAPGSTARGIEAADESVSIVNSTVKMEGESERPAIEAGLGAVTLSNDTVTQVGEKDAPGIVLELPSPANVNGVRITMSGAKDESAGVEAEAGAESLEHVEVGGTWQGPPLTAEGGTTTIADSRLIANTADAAPAVEFMGLGEGRGLLVQRSVLQSSPTAKPATLYAISANMTLDSSEVLGGANGVLFDQGGGKVRTLTVAASTIDAGLLGQSDPSGVSDVEAGVGPPASIADVNVEGSILFEPQLAEVAAGGKEVVINCVDSAVPSQTASGPTGQINCASGSNGNTNSSTEVESLFAAPITNYVLSPTSSAIDSVPASAISLPFGLTPSTTDLNGNPRAEGVACATLQDEGALELPGHGTPCPTPPAPAPVAKPLAGVISSLTISPSAFFAAPSGATVSAAAAKAKKYGAKVSYRDSQVATTTFTVLRETGGRKQGKSCKKPSKHNRHGKRCTILTAVGSFVHVDIAGANSFHFSGRIKGRKLSAGGYRLQAVARDAAGNGVAVDKSFKIE